MSETMTREQLPPLPAQPAGVAWPTRDWPTGELPGNIDKARFARLMDHAFAATPPDDLGETFGVVIVKNGRLVHEQYAASHGPDVTCPSWSKAKSITHALAGILVGDGKLDIHAAADVPEWQGAGDPRRAITLDLLLRMSSGLAFREDYVPEHPSDVIEMLWGPARTTSRISPPHFRWSTNRAVTGPMPAARPTSSAAVWRAAGVHGPDFEAFMRARLFDPLGMMSPEPKFDAAGTFIGSSFFYCTPRDFARFGLLYLRDGVWEGKRLLPGAGPIMRAGPPGSRPMPKAPMARIGGSALPATEVSRPMAMKGSTRSVCRISTWWWCATARRRSRRRKIRSAGSPRLSNASGAPEAQAPDAEADRERAGENDAEPVGRRAAGRCRAAGGDIGEMRQRMAPMKTAGASSRGAARRGQNAAAPRPAALAR